MHCTCGEGLLRAITKDGLYAGKDDNSVWVWFLVTRDEKGKVITSERKENCSGGEKQLLNELVDKGRIVCRSNKVGTEGKRCILTSMT